MNPQLLFQLSLTLSMPIARHIGDVPCLLPRSPDGTAPAEHTKKASLLDKHVLVSVRLFDRGGRLVQCAQVSGVTAESNTPGAVRVASPAAPDGLLLPAFPSLFHKASPGPYRLLNTGEVVRDPDFLCMWDAIEDPPRSVRFGAV
jgi:hypothetical protein